MSPDLAVAIVAHDHAAVLGPCLRSLQRRSGGLRLAVTVVDNGPSGADAELVRREFGWVDAARVENRGFAAGNNDALRRLDRGVPWVLFLNPDTELVDGNLRTLVAAFAGRPEVGAVGVRQIDGAGRWLPTIRREPHALRALGEALGSERLPAGGHPRLGERELRPDRYDRETACDWLSGSFVLVRREALDAAGPLDERFFLYLEETDLCRRIRQAGFRVVYSPLVTVVHRESDRRASERHLAQAALSRRLYAAKHFGRAHRAAYLAASALGYALRSRRPPARAALATLLGLRPPPFGQEERRRIQKAPGPHPGS